MLRQRQSSKNLRRLVPLSWPGLAAGRPNSRRHALHVVSFSAGRSLPSLLWLATPPGRPQMAWPTLDGQHAAAAPKLDQLRRPFSGRGEVYVCGTRTDLQFTEEVQQSNTARLSYTVPLGAAWRRGRSEVVYTATSDAQLHSVCRAFISEIKLVSIRRVSRVQKLMKTF